MQKTVMTSVVILLLAAVAVRAEVKAAKASLVNGKGESVGTAQLKQTSKGVSLTLAVTNLPAGVHGFHIHTVGKCEPPDFKSAGGHFNPEGKKHGWENPEGHHLGDLQNLTVNAQGKGKTKVQVPGVNLGEGPSSLFQPGGTALVIHAQPDDMKTDPAGNAGARIACGVITK